MSQAKEMPTDAWWVYMLSCADQSLYTGIAKDVVKRFDEHNNSPKAAKYTRARRPVSLVYVEAVEDRSSALKRELAIKALSRVQKQQLISQVQHISQRYADRLDIVLTLE